MNETIRLLAERIAEIESARSTAAPAIPLGGGLEQLFATGALAAGSLVEWIASTSGAGAWTLALLLAKYACGDRKMLVIADHQRSFYPFAAIQLGIEPRHIVVIRAPRPRDTLLAIHQALRCSAVGAVIGQFDRLSEREMRRLQLAAEVGGGIGSLVRPAAAKDAPSFATVRLLVAPRQIPRHSWRVEDDPAMKGGLSSARNRHMSVQILRCRGKGEGRSVHLEIDDETGDVRAFPQLAAAAHSASSA